jgi:WD40 repeat protein
MLVVVGLGIGMVLSVPYRFIERRQMKARRYITRACVAATAGIALAAVGVTGASASAAASRALQTVRVTGAGTSLAATSPGAQLWVARYNDPGNGTDDASSVAVSPSGKTVFVTGYSECTACGAAYHDYATVAYNATTGAELWVKRYNGPVNGDDDATSVAVSPSGKTVFVTGSSEGTASSYDYATVAYNAVTGAQRWVKRYTGDPYDAPSVAVSPNGSTVFVTGSSHAATTGDDDYATVAYNAATGHQQWVKRYNSPHGGSLAHSLTVSPNGKTVFVTGSSLGTNNGYDYATVAYNAATGAQRWVRRYNGATEGDRGANSVAVSPNGKTVFVTGSSYTGSASDYDYATVAYNAATGAQLWARRYSGPVRGLDAATSVAVSPSGKTVFVTGYSQGTAGSFDYATVAYKAATGARLWVRRSNGPRAGGFGDRAYSVAVSPSGSTVYVTGEWNDDAAYATVAYNAATGAQRWVKRYASPVGGSAAFSVAVSRTAGTVFVTGYSVGDGSGPDYVTIAYEG